MDMFKVEFAGEDYCLLYNGAAMFALQDVDLIFTAINKDIDVFCRVVSVLSEQGELYRRYEGHDHGGSIDADNFKLSSTPAEMMSMRVAVLNALLSGMGREIEPEEAERDLSLEKFKKKPDGKRSLKKRTT